MARILVLITIFYVLGIILGRYYFTIPETVYLAVGALSWSTLHLLFKRVGLQVLIPLLLIFLAAGSLALNLSLQKAAGSIRHFSGERCTLVGMVEDEPLWREGDVVFPLRTEKVTVKGEEQPVSSTVRVVVRLDDPEWDGYVQSIEQGGAGEESPGIDGVGRNKAFSALSYGQKVSLQGVLYEPGERRNPGGFDYRAFLETRGVAATFYGSANGVTHLGIAAELSPLRRAALDIKAKMSAVLEAYLPEREGRLLAGMLFGERRALDEDTEKHFARSGVSHLLAVSGLHVGMVAAVLWSLWKKARVTGAAAFFLTLFFLFAYVYITGLKPATLRAFIMIAMAMGAVYLGRRRDLFTALAAAAFITLVYNPLLLFNAGFQFSYAATASIILFASPLRQRIIVFFDRAASLFGALPANGGKELPQAEMTADADTVATLTEALSPVLSTLRGKLSSLAAVTLAAQAGVLPLTAYYFGEISFVALLANILVLPLMPLIIFTGLTAAVLGLVIPPVAALLLLAGYPLLFYTLFVTEFVGGLPYAFMSVYPPRLHWLGYYYLFFFSAALWGRKLLHLVSIRRDRLSFYFLTAVLLLALFFTWPGVFEGSGGNLEVVFLDVGQGDAIYIRTPHGGNILLDGGGRPAYLGEVDGPGRSVVLPYLEFRRVKKLDMVIVSHPHEDHYGGLLAVLEEIPADMLVTSADESSARHYLELLNLAERKGIPRKIVEKGDRLFLGPSLEAVVLNPPANLYQGTGSDSNNNSLVLDMGYGEVRFLFTGDIEASAVERLLREGLLPRSDILKVPHHGGYLEAMPSFLETVEPQAAVITVGTNPFGHPHPYTLEALQEKGVKIYRTDWHGAVTVRSDGLGWSVEYMLTPLSGEADAAIHAVQGLKMEGGKEPFQVIKAGK